MASSGTTIYLYDIENRLVATSAGIALGYDPLGRLACGIGTPRLAR